MHAYFLRLRFLPAPRLSFAGWINYPPSSIHGLAPVAESFLSATIIFKLYSSSRAIPKDPKLDPLPANRIDALILCDPM
jgi:hypothetical protein